MGRDVAFAINVLPWEFTEPRLVKLSRNVNPYRYCTLHHDEKILHLGQLVDGVHTPLSTYLYCQIPTLVLAIATINSLMSSSLQPYPSPISLLFLLQRARVTEESMVENGVIMACMSPLHAFR